MPNGFYRIGRFRDLDPRRVMFIAASSNPQLRGRLGPGKAVKIACLAPLVALR